MGRSEVSTSVVNWSEGLRNSVSVIIRRYTDHRLFHCFFLILWVPFCIIVYIVVCFICFYFILYVMYFYCYVYVFLLLCICCPVYSVSLCCSVYCFCVNVYLLLSPRVNPIAVYKYISTSIRNYHKKAVTFSEHYN